MDRVRSLVGLLAAVGGNRAVRRVFWVSVFGVAAVLVFLSVTLPGEVTLRAGEIAPYTIEAPEDFVNQPVTDALKQEAASKVQPIYTNDATVTQEVLAAFQGAIQDLSEAQQTLVSALSASTTVSSSTSVSSGSAKVASSQTAPVTLNGEAQDVSQELQVPGVSLTAYAEVLSMPSATLSSLEDHADLDLSALLSTGVQQSALTTDAASLEQEIQAGSGSPAVLAFLAALAAHDLKANQFVDTAATTAAQQAAMDAVTPVVVARGQVIVRAGDPVTATDVMLLQEAGLAHPGGPLAVIGGAVALVLGLMALVWAYLNRFYRRGLQSESHLVLVGSLLVGSLAATRLGMEISPFLAPTSWFAILAAVGMGDQPAFFVGALGGLMVGLLTHSFAAFVTSTVSAWVTVFVLGRVDQRGQLWRAGVYAALAGVAAMALLVLFAGQNPALAGELRGAASTTVPVWRDMAAAGGAGLLGAALAIGTLPYIEALGMLTTFHLQELANPGRPLLRRLMAEAPGTYHHSLMVANLAEAACQVVGGDPLLVRAGAYYHDIGKMKRPQFFVENQLGGENPHDKLSPHLSARVIASHVRDGVEYGRKAALPREIVNIIRSHHGTTIIRYFYERARQQVGGVLDEAPFRYEGPRPQTREEAVVMLADSVEAAVRAHKDPTANQIEEVIHSVIAERMEDGQLSRSPLTLRDVDSITQTFQRILVGAYHARIEYPEQLAAEVSRQPASEESVATVLSLRHRRRP